MDPLAHFLVTLLVLGVLPGLMAWVAVTDWRHRRIDNRVSAALLAGMPVLALLTGMGWDGFATAMLLGLVAFAIGLALFAAGMMAAGDVKLLGALLPWFGTGANAYGFVLVLSIVGAGLTLAFLALARMTAPAGGALAVNGVAGGDAAGSLPTGPASSPRSRSVGQLLAPLGVLVLLAVGASDPAAWWAGAFAVSLPLPAPLVPLAAFVVLSLGLATATATVFALLRSVGLAPALAVADPAGEESEIRGGIEVPYGIAIAATALAALPALAALHGAG